MARLENISQDLTQSSMKDATLSASPLHNGDTGDRREAIEQSLEGLA